jgi:hypothetical protein
MDASSPPSRDIRALLLLLALGLLVCAAIIFLNAITGRVPLLGSLPGDLTVILGTTPVQLPFSSCILVGAVLTGLASLVSFLLRDTQ